MTRRYWILGIGAAAILIVAGIAVLGWGRGYFPGSGESFLGRTPAGKPELSSVHLYRDPTVAIAEIQLLVFYVIPQDKIAQAVPDFSARVRPVLEQVRSFHKLEFRGQSKLTYAIYPEPVILEKPARVYDTDNTSGGNPAAFLAVRAELERRALTPEGDLYLTNFGQLNRGAFPVVVIVYEGVGASGAPGAVLISNTYFKDPAYEPFRAALLAHEFGHALGFPDRYDTTTGAPAVSDIMGSGRHRPLEHTYIGYDLLKDAGLAINK